jgi:hypothetical protein
MNAKYKAEELVDKFSDYNDLTTLEEIEIIIKIGKRNALICVDEMLDCNSTSVDSEDEFEFWKQVKLEIKNLK